MVTSGGDGDRRQHPRYSPRGLYKMYGGDSREETAHATDQGPGGAFLPVKRALPDGTLLIIEVHEPEVVHRGPPVLLVAEVVYSKQKPTLGLGIRWKHALCVEGLDRLALFLEGHFNLFLDPKKIGAFHREQLDGAVQYDFHFGSLKPIPEDTIERWRAEDRIYDIQYPQTFMAKADHIETRARFSGPDAGPSEVTAPPVEIGRDEVAVDETWQPPEVGFDDGIDPVAKKDSVDFAEEATELGFDDFTQEVSSGIVSGQTNELTDWASDIRHRLPVKVPVLLMPMVGDETIGATVRNLSRTHLFVLLVEELRIYRSDRLVVRFPLSLGPLSVKLVIVGTVQRIVRDRKSGRIGLDLSLDTMDEGKHKGIFKEFVTVLGRRVNPDA